MWRFQPLLGAAVIGAFVMVAANVLFARFAGGAEWTDPAIFMSPFAAAFGAIAGAAIAALIRRPRPRRPDDRHRLGRRIEKRKNR
jgi:membrane associated rhomboid family serine protease